jgi:hypothetical protein
LRLEALSESGKYTFRAGGSKGLMDSHTISPITVERSQLRAPGLKHVKKCVEKLKWKQI